MNLGSISKALAGTLAGVASTAVSSYIMVPESVVMPWYGYVIIGVINAAIGFGFVYFAPRNTA